MQKIVTFFLGISILVLVFKEQFSDISITNKELDKFEGNAIERGISHVIHNVTKSDECKALFGYILEPHLYRGKNYLAIKNDSKALYYTNKKIESKNANSKYQCYCGQEVIIDYSIKMENLPKQNKINQRIRLGDNTIFPVIPDSILTNMKEGEVRSGNYFVKSNNTSIPNSMIDIEVTLHKILSPAQNFENIKIFDELVIEHTPVVCSDEVQADIKITNFKNQMLYHKSEEKIKVGGTGTPPVLSYLLNYKPLIGQRTAIISSKHLYPLKFFNLNNIPLDPEELLLVEISNIVVQ